MSGIMLNRYTVVMGKGQSRVHRRNTEALREQACEYQLGGKEPKERTHREREIRSVVQEKTKLK